MNEPEFSRLILAMVALVTAALGSGYVFQRLGMPRVIGEIVGGIVLGPSVLGVLSPQLFDWLFRASAVQMTGLEAIYWIGLVLLMFTSGFRVQRSLTTDDRRTIVVILVAATALPFVLGYAAPAVIDLGHLMGSAGNPESFRLVMGIAVAVTSIPVIAKIFLDLGIMETRFAKIVLGCATLQDLALWTVLAVATGLAAGAGDGSPWALVQTIAVTLAFLAFSIWLAPRALPSVSRFRFNLLSKASPIGYTLTICFLFTALASVLGVNAIFGALVAGLAVGALPDIRFADVRNRIADVSLGFFVPIYFALVGLKIDLPGYFDPWTTVAFIGLSSVVEVACVFVVARLIGRPPLTSFNLGMAMNTRGGPGIVLASVAFAAGIINETFFVTLVLAALLTSLASGVWFRLLVRRGLPLYE